MNNFLLKRHIKVQQLSPFSNNRFVHPSSKHKKISHELSRSVNIHSSINKNSIDLIDFSKLHPKSAMNNNILYSIKNQQNPALFNRQFEPTHRLLRTTINPKEELKPQQTSQQLKQIQHKISIFVKNTRGPSSNQYNRRQQQNPQLYTRTYMEKSKLQTMLKSRNNPEQDQTSKQQYTNNQTGSYNNWYLKAIETHLKENNQKIDLKYCTQDNSFTRKTVHNQRKTGNTYYPKLSTGFKKRSVSYQVKYI